MKYIIDYITGFFNYLGDLFSAIGQLILSIIQIVGKAAEFLFSVIGALPTVLTTVAIGIIVACIIYKLVGREGGEAS